MVLKSFIAAITSVLLFVITLPIFHFFFDSTAPEKIEFLYVVFYSVFAILPILFVILYVLNLIVQWTLKNKKKYRPNSIYFVICLLSTLVPILLFILFDNSDWGKDPGNKTLLGIISDYLGVFLFSLIIILINRKIVWKNFKKESC